MKKILLSTLAIGALGWSTAAFAAHELRIGFVTINDPQHELAKKYKEVLEARTKGEITVKIFPAAQLGKIPRQIENLKLGAQGGFVSPPGFLSGINRGFQVMDAPGLFKNFWHAHNVLTSDEFRSKYYNLADKAGIIGVSGFNYGPTAIASLKPIRTLADMKGLKVRVLATKMESKLASELGMTGVPMPFSEVLPALQRKTIDGCRSSAVVMGALKFYTTAKFITLTEAGYIPSVLWISKRWLAKLPKNLQKTVTEVGAELEPWSAKMAWGFNQRAEKLWKDNGAEVIRLSDAEKAEMTAKLAPLGDEFLGKAKATKDMYALLKQVIAKTPATEVK